MAPDPARNFAVDVEFKIMRDKTTNESFYLSRPGLITNALLLSFPEAATKANYLSFLLYGQ